MNYALMNAYALGYYDGRATGVEANPFEEDEFRFAYSEGYQRGVGDYCELDEEYDDTRTRA